jgi:hypothetical protein
MANPPPYTGTTIGTIVLPTAFTTVQKTVGTSAVQLTATATPCASMPVLKADPSNTGVVYIITSAAGTAATGLALGPGEAVPVPIDDLAKVWLIASAASQKVAAIAGVAAP